MSVSSDMSTMREVTVLSQRIINMANSMAKSQCKDNIIVVPIPGEYPSMSPKQLERELKTFAGLDPEDRVVFESFNLNEVQFRCIK